MAPIKNLMFGFIACSLIVIPSGFAEFSQARLMEIQGKAQYQKAGMEEWQDVAQDTILQENDKIKTEPGAKIWLELTGNDKTAEVEVRESTEVNFDTFQHDPEKDLDKTLLGVTKGSILIKAEKLRGDSTFEVKTPTTIAGIRGTIFEVNVDKEQN